MRSILRLSESNGRSHILKLINKTIPQVNISGLSSFEIQNTAETAITERAVKRKFIYVRLQQHRKEIDCHFLENHPQFLMIKASKHSAWMLCLLTLYLFLGNICRTFLTKEERHRYKPQRCHHISLTYKARARKQTEIIVCHLWSKVKWHKRCRTHY